ncbi:Phosphodiesterase/alkaline phosphatase D [Planctomycetales bacterium 10988]|nr:Phosphodiesterase/alkaline phosphatase D [Planctomycetales bacterium 10988]
MNTSPKNSQRLQIFFTTFMLFASCFISQANADEFAHLNLQETISEFAFGSCCLQGQEQPIWKSIVESEPGVFMMIGDNIYGDSEDMNVLREKWKMLANEPYFKQLRENYPFIATWDDHDFGVNDGGVEYPKKKESQKVFLDFLKEPQDSPRRQQEGVYTSYEIGPVEKRVQLILLDTRYFRTPLKTGFEAGEPGEGIRGKYVPNFDPNATMLGEKQWTWLKEQLLRPAQVRVIASSIQVLPMENGAEKWGNLPLERERLIKIIASTKANGVLFISGDRHFADMMKLSAEESPLDYPLYEVTSSSLNRPGGALTKSNVRYRNEINRYRVGIPYFETNFGMITIDWNEEDPVIRLQIRDVAGEVVSQLRIKLSELQ